MNVKKWGDFMDIDLKNLSIIVGVVSTIIGLAYKLMPRASDNIKKELELLKMAKDTGVNHLPILRHLNSRIHEEYVNETISLKKKIDVRLGNILFISIIMIAIFGIIGYFVGFILSAILSFSEQTHEYIVLGFASVGLVGGILGGLSQATDDLNSMQKEIDDRIQSVVENDKHELSKGNDKPTIIT